MKKRLCALVLCILMCATLLPSTAFAVEVETGNAVITAPAAKQAPSYEATSAEPDKYTVEVLRWTDVSANTDISEAQYNDHTNPYYHFTFEGGKEYRVTVRFKPKSGYTLAATNNFTINGNAATNAGEGGAKRSYKFTATGTGGGLQDVAYTASLKDIYLTLPGGYHLADLDNLGSKKEVCITNTGNRELSIGKGSFYLTGPDAAKFDFCTLSTHSNIPVGRTYNGSWYIQPVSGLETGTYTATLNFMDSKNLMKEPATATITLSVGDHHFNTSVWKSDSKTHWNECTDETCMVRGNEAAHNMDKSVGAVAATFDNDGETGALYCSVCNRKMADSKPVAAGKYIRESRVTMEPSAITNKMCANDLTFTSADPYRYKVEIFRVLDTTDTSLNTENGSYPRNANFIADHAYYMDLRFNAVGNYVYDETHEDYWSTFYLNGKVLRQSNAVSVGGSCLRQFTFTANESNVVVYKPIEQVDITGVTLPVEEAVCVTDGALPGGDHYTVAYAGGASTWHYVDNKGYTRAVAPGDTFIAGMSYTVSIDVTSLGNTYVLSEDTKFTINGYPAKFAGASGKTFTVEATFRCEERQLIRKFDLTGLNTPLAGETPQNSVNATIYIGNSVDHTSTPVTWYNGAGSGWTTSFQSGNAYHAEIVLDVPQSGWAFSKDVAVTVNGSAASIKEIKFSRNNERVTVVLQAMSVDKTAINSCSITGVPTPWEGCEPEDVTLQCATNQYTARIVYWEMRPSGHTIYSGSFYKTFESGKARAYIQITAASGFKLAANPTVTINGMTATQEGSNYYIEFDVQQSETITSLFISGVPTLIEGETIDFAPAVYSETPHTKVEINTYPVTLDTNEGESQIVTPVWTLTNMGTWRDTVLAPGASVVKDGYYTLYLAVTHDAGYQWDEKDNLRWNIVINRDLASTDIVGFSGDTLILAVVVNGEAKHSSLTASVSAFGEESDKTTLTLFKEGESSPMKYAFMSGCETSATFEDLAQGSYILRVSRPHHISREYTVSVGEAAVTKDIALSLDGDVNLDGMTDDTDLSDLLRHVAQIETMDNVSYADLDHDGDVDAADVTVLAQMLQGMAQ